MAKKYSPPAKTSNMISPSVVSPEDNIVTGGAAFIERGDTGLKRFSGIISEEFLNELQGSKGIKMFTEMKDNHPVIGGILFAIQQLARGVKWTIEPASESPEDIEIADFVSSCMDDMELSWQDNMSEFLSFLPYGWSYHEINYKVRGGKNNKNPKYRSRYEDNKIGWAGFPIRSQDSLEKWELDAEGSVLGMWQSIIGAELRSNRGELPKGYRRYIPAEKALHFRTLSYKNNPHGRSILRNSVVTYLRQRKIEEIECIGIERDLAGLPVVYAPAKIMGKSADVNEQAIYLSIQNLAQSIRRDKMEGVVMPSDCFKNADGSISTTKMYDLQLLSTGGSRQFDTNAIVGRHDQKISMTVLADFIMIGHQKVGGQNVTDSKTKLFTQALSAFLDIISEQFSRKAIPSLLELNGLTPKKTPTLKHSEIDEADLQSISDFLQKCSAAGMPLFPDTALESHLRQLAGFPEPSADEVREVGTGGGDRSGDGGSDLANASEELARDDNAVAE